MTENRKNDGERHDEIYAGLLGNYIEMVRYCIRDAGSKLRVPTHIVDHQLHREAPIPRLHATRQLEVADVITIFDAEEELMDYLIKKIRMNPTLSVVAGFTSEPDDWLDYGLKLAEQRTPVMFEGESNSRYWGHAPRFFGVSLKNESMTTSVIQRALRMKYDPYVIDPMKPPAARPT